MFHQSPVKNLRRRWKLVFFVGVMCASIAGLLTLFFPLEHRADAQVLIVSRSRYGVDPYTTVKSAERVGENIAQIMETSDFYLKVKQQEGYNINWNYFDSLSERKKRKKWMNSINGSVVFGTGVLNISAYHTSPSQAYALAGAAAQTLVDHGWEYVGSDVSIQIINHPVTTSWPVRPNIVINVVLGFAAGLLLMSFMVVRKR